MNMSELERLVNVMRRLRAPDGCPWDREQTHESLKKCLVGEAAANIRVVSIVDRFLEHSRIYRFANGGAPKYFIGSADLMPRNLSRRVEILVPVESPALRDELDVILFTSLHDRRKGRRLIGENRYSHTSGTLRHESERAQISLYNYYKKRLERPEFQQDPPATEYRSI